MQSYCHEVFYKAGSMKDNKQRRNTIAHKVSALARELSATYTAMQEKTLDEMIAFSVRFESIHPLQEGNGRIGRLIMFKECLGNGIVPFIMDDAVKMYYCCLQEWNIEKGCLRDTILAAQDGFKKYLTISELIIDRLPVSYWVSQTIINESGKSTGFVKLKVEAC